MSQASKNDQLYCNKQSFAQFRAQHAWKAAGTSAGLLAAAKLSLSVRCCALAQTPVPGKRKMQGGKRWSIAALCNCWLLLLAREPPGEGSGLEETTLANGGHSILSQICTSWKCMQMIMHPPFFGVLPGCRRSIPG